MNSGSRPLTNTTSSTANERNQTRAQRSVSPNTRDVEANDSEAETDILSDEDVINHRRKQPAQTTSESRRSSAADIDSKKSRKSNGIAGPKLKPDPEDRAQSTDLYSRGTSEPLSSDEEDRKAQSVEPKKRKFSDASHKSKAAEPPRQRPRIDTSAKSSPNLPKSRQTSPQSPIAPSRSVHNHKRSNSMQSNKSIINRRKRDVSSASRMSGDDRKSASKWADDSSDESAGPFTRSIPNLAPPRNTRGITRPLASPARPPVPHGKRADKYGTTPLAKFCEKGKLEEAINAYETDPEALDKADNGGFTPLQKAALGGHTEVIKFLLSKGCRKDCFSKEDKDTPLIDAVENGHLEVIKLLLDAGVNPHHSNKKGIRAIDAVDEEDENADEIRTALQKAMAAYQIDDAEADEAVQDSPVISRREPGAASTRPDLLYQPHNKQTLLKYSTEGDTEAVGMFLLSVDPDNSCLVAAARGGHEAVLNLLLASAKVDKDPDPLKYEETPLLAAIGRSNINVIKLLINLEDFNPTRKTVDGRTYADVAEERKGPKWQQEVDLLNERFDRYIEKQKDFKSSKRANQENNRHSGKVANGQSKDAIVKSPRIAKAKLNRTESTTDDKSDKPDKLDKAEKAEQSHKPEKLKKRLSNSKEGLSSEKRKKKTVDDESSQESDAPPQSPTRHKITRSRHNSLSLKPGVLQPTKSEPSSTSSRIDIKSKGKPGRKAKEIKEPRSTRLETESVDSEIESTAMNSHYSSKAASPDADSISKSKQRKKDVKNRKQDENSPGTDKETNMRKRKEAEESRIRESNELAARKKEQERLALLDSVPPPLREAIELGKNRSLKSDSYTDEGRIKFGIQYLYSPIPVFARQHIDNSDDSHVDKPYDYGQENGLTLSWYAVGILGLSNLELSEFPQWEKIEVKDEHRRTFYDYHDQKKIFMTYSWLEMGMDGWNRSEATARESKAKEQFLTMSPLYWIRASDLQKAVESRHDLREFNWQVQKRDDFSPKVKARSVWASFGRTTPPEIRQFREERDKKAALLAGQEEEATASSSEMIPTLPNGYAGVNGDYASTSVPDLSTDLSNLSTDPSADLPHDNITTNLPMEVVKDDVEMGGLDG